MDTADWFGRWREGRIGFHEGAPNRRLVRHARELGTPNHDDGTPKRVLVPLCGKSEDLTYLAQLGFEAVGVELVESAVRAFFSEHALTPGVEDYGSLRSFRAEKGLVLTFEYDQSAMSGPPFSVADSELRALFASGTRANMVPALAL